MRIIELETELLTAGASKPVGNWEVKNQTNNVLGNGVTNVAPRHLECAVPRINSPYYAGCDFAKYTWQIISVEGASTSTITNANVTLQVVNNKPRLLVDNYSNGTITIQYDIAGVCGICDGDGPQLDSSRTFTIKVDPKYTVAINGSGNFNNYFCVNVTNPPGAPDTWTVTKVSPNIAGTYVRSSLFGPVHTPTDNKLLVGDYALYEEMPGTMTLNAGIMTYDIVGKVLTPIVKSFMSNPNRAFVYLGFRIKSSITCVSETLPAWYYYYFEGNKDLGTVVETCLPASNSLSLATAGWDIATRGITITWTNFYGTGFYSQNNTPIVITNTRLTNGSNIDVTLSNGVESSNIKLTSLNRIPSIANSFMPGKYLLKYTYPPDAGCESRTETRTIDFFPVSLAADVPTNGISDNGGVLYKQLNAQAPSAITFLRNTYYPQYSYGANDSFILILPHIDYSIRRNQIINSNNVFANAPIGSVNGINFGTFIPTQLSPLMIIDHTMSNGQLVPAVGGKKYILMLFRNNSNLVSSSGILTGTLTFIYDIYISYNNFACSNFYQTLKANLGNFSTLSPSQNVTLI